MKAVELTEDEIEVVSDYLFRKIIRLEEAGLKDSKCYPLLLSVYAKLNKLKKNEK